MRNIVRATEDLVDDALDRAGDFECGVRRSVSRALDDDDWEDDCDDWDDDCDNDWDDDCDGDWDDDWDRRHGRGRRRRDGRRRQGGRRRPVGRRGDDGYRRPGPDEGEPYASEPRPRPRSRPVGDSSGGQEELTALRDQLELLRGRMDRRWGGSDHPGEGGASVPRSRGAEDVGALKDELARLADRIDRIRDAR
ncbi:hypothetical protein J7F01_27800 [Streptomyces sp. ISL-22]|uniref:hypothetical protein n=1 Tax=unclassified Streptomyces TaxID=2593676 RepID=UPI001BE860F9|nr:MULTISPECIES: hypothetical protein [unclassified Streptomyces]MBT2422743.1 hypothetical protein [Streptomyces sp. ISL-24]MBT2435894.1 hypothetical protein [Streptomyces sp. ISL-22]